MATISNPQALHTAYLSLPQSVKEWLSSEAFAYTVREINGRLGFRGKKFTAIPALTLRLCAQDLDPLDFINELSHELDVSFQTARSITEDIEEKLLRPIEGDLRRD